MNSSRRASALLLVLTAIALLSLVILGVVQVTQGNVENHLLFAKRDQARRLAESGIAFALHPEITPEDPLLEQKINNIESFKVTFVSEGSRFNINTILTQNDLPLLIRLFRTWDLSLEEATALADALADWADPDSLRRLNGAEADDYESLGRAIKPSNRPFKSVDEMANVIGMEALEKNHPDWRDSFTVWSEGPLDLMEAPAELISIAAEVGLPQAESLVHYRTAVDTNNPNNPTKSKTKKTMTLDQALQILGISGDRIAKVAQRLMTNSQTFRVKSIGKVDHYEHTIQAVLRRNIYPPVFLFWNES